ncbi:hypothetical protein Vafri_7615 [Volvox africanus]|uniref:TATA element modulatory factor 1 TATA binding domain-containing protein n=1 Tax=Volvox africanus TaxID=51714 RepID=A0A8J4B178_9CHLO|nr:hypothetical protein Vafri_7615 [Volvox africanus]
MWGNFVPDLGKLGEQLTAVAGEALQKATADMEKSIDNTLGIRGGSKAAAGTVAVEAQVSSASGRSDGSAPLDPTTPNAAPGSKPGQKKVVKKIVRRVVKNSGTDLAAAGAGAGAGTSASGGATPPATEDGNAALGIHPACGIGSSEDSQSQPNPGSYEQHTTAVENTRLTAPPLLNGALLPDPESDMSLLGNASSTDGNAQPVVVSVATGLGNRSRESDHGAAPNGILQVGNGSLNAAETVGPSRIGVAAGNHAIQPGELPGGEFGGGDAALCQHQRDEEQAPAAASAAAEGSAEHTTAPAAGGDDWDGWQDEGSDMSVTRETGAAGSPGACGSSPALGSANARIPEGALATTVSEGNAVALGEMAAAGPKPEKTLMGGSTALEQTGSRESVRSAEVGREGPLECGAADQESTSVAVAGSAEAPDISPPPPPATTVNGDVVAAGSGADNRAKGKAANAGAAVDAPADLPSSSAVAAASREVEDLRRTLAQLQGELRERDLQLQLQAVRVSDLQQVVAGLQTRNEELALRSAGLSEADFEAVRTEFEQRLAAAERKVYALTKERDALRKGAEKLADYGALVKEKDDIIKQVMDEGEKLSKKQVELESIIKRLRGQLTAVEAERDKLATRLAAEESGAAELRRVKAKLEKDLVSAGEQAKADLESQREHFELLLQKAKSDQVDAEERARDAAAQGLGRRLRESEARCEALAESCAELRDALDRQRQAADLREEMLKADINDLERRCQAAELRHQDLAAKMPEATRPLLRQIEAMQSAMEAQAEAWAGAESSLHSRVTDAEGRAAAAGERERLAMDKMQLLSAKVSGLEASLSASRSEVRLLNEQLEEASKALAGAREAAAAAANQAEMLSERCRLQEQQLEQMETDIRELREAERTARTAVEHDTAALRREFERRLVEADLELGALRAQVQAEAMKRPEPPAMAAPGYRWVLVKDGEQQSQHQQRNPNSSGAETSYRASNAPTPAAITSANIGSELLASLRSGGGGGAFTASASEPGGGGSGSGHHGGGGGVGTDGVQTVMASELESLRAALRAKTGELVAAQQQVAELEATRDRCVPVCLPVCFCL